MTVEHGSGWPPTTYPPTRNAGATPPDDDNNLKWVVTMSGPNTVGSAANAVALPWPQLQQLRADALTVAGAESDMSRLMAQASPRPRPTPRHLFLDLETTGLTSGFDEITEAAWIADDGHTAQFFVAHDAIPSEWVLRKTDYLTRIAPAPKTPLRDVLEILTADVARLAGRDALVYLVGACPAFDDRFLRAAYRTAFPTPREPPYNYHVIDIEATAMGALGHAAPCTLGELRAALGISGANPAAHTALADAAEVKLIWDALRARGDGGLP